MKTINDYVRECHSVSVQKGFYDDVEVNERFIGTQIALMHSELSEALEELRNGITPTYYRHDGKPEGFTVELADCIIRIFDLCGALGLDLGQALELKMEYNKKRKYKHGRNNF